MAADIVGAPVRQGTLENQWPLVGRAREVFLLKESIRDRHGAVITGAAGVGKTALATSELDTALRAATGSTDKQIAEMMHLSVRTVENRLHRAYQKLGLSHPRELAEALRDLPGA